MACCFSFCSLKDNTPSLVNLILEAPPGNMSKYFRKRKKHTHTHTCRLLTEPQWLMITTPGVFFCVHGGRNGNQLSEDAMAQVHPVMLPPGVWVKCRDVTIETFDQCF